MVSISACHAEDPGSIPGGRVWLPDNLPDCIQAGKLSPLAYPLAYRLAYPLALPFADHLAYPLAFRAAQWGFCQSDT